jgi:hypothetical protein
MRKRISERFRERTGQLEQGWLSTTRKKKIG